MACVLVRGSIRKGAECGGCGAHCLGPKYADKPVDNNYVYLRDASGQVARRARNSMFSCTQCDARYCSKICARSQRCGEQVPVAALTQVPPLHLGSAAGGHTQAIGDTAQQAVDQLIAGAAHDAAAMCSISGMLHEACSQPTIPTIEYLAASLAARVYPLLRDSIADAVNAESLLKTNRGTTQAMRTAEAHQWAWLMPSLLLRSSAECQASDEAHGDDPKSRTKQADKVRERTQLAEAGKWHELLRQYVLDLTKHQADKEAQHTEAATASTFSNTEEQAFQRTAAKMRVGNTRAAKQILAGSVQAPRTEATRDEIDSLLCTNRSSNQPPAQEFDRQRTALKAASSKNKHTNAVLTRSVRRRARILNPGAAPGPSGWRNIHIQGIMGTAGGAIVLKRWCKMWIAGSVSMATSVLWTAAVISPIDCGETLDDQGRIKRKLRPIALAEALLKFAEGLAVDAALPQLTAFLEPAQLGAATPDGAPIIIRAIRSWAADIVESAHNPATTPRADGSSPSEDAIVGLDLKNAYGLIYRSSCLEGLCHHVPELAPLAAAEWQNQGTRVWQVVDGKWQLSFTARGGWQGSRLMQVAFCVGLENTMRSIPSINMLSRIGYQDDQYLVGAPKHVLALWPHMQQALAKDGHELRPAKCKTWLPALDNVDALPFHASEMCKLAGRSRGGLTLLGGAADSGLAQGVADDQIMCSKAKERAEAAMSLVQRVCDFAKSAVCGNTFHMAWTLLSKSIIHALDYDAKLIGAQRLQCVAQPLYDVIDEAVSVIFGTQLGRDNLEQLRLPGCLAGCGFRRLALSPHADAAYWAMWSENTSLVSELCTNLGRPVRNVVDSCDAQQARAKLLSAGINCSETRDLSFTSDASQLYESSPWHEDTPAALVMTDRDADAEARFWQVEGIGNMRRVKYLSRLLRGLDALKAAQLWTDGDEYMRAALLSAGGPGTGSIWQLPPRGNEMFENPHFRAAMAIRLCTVNLDSGMHCHYKRASDEDHSACEKLVDRRGLHAELCGIGPVRQRTHRNVARTLGFCLKRAGANVDYERAAPQLYIWRPNGSCEEAYMDVWCSWPGALTNTKVDVTVRSVFASRYKNTCSKPGVAADTAAGDKQRRYGPDVWTLNFETRGRLGGDGIALLKHLASEAMCWSPSGQRRLTHFWRTRLERTLVHAQAEGLLLCLGAKLDCINAVSRMGSARRTADGVPSRSVVAATPPSSLAHPADADAGADSTFSGEARHAAERSAECATGA